MTPTCDLHILQKKSHLNIDFCGSVTSKTPRRFMKSRYFCTKLSAGLPGCKTYTQTIFTAFFRLQTLQSFFSVGLFVVSIALRAARKNLDTRVIAYNFSLPSHFPINSNTSLFPIKTGWRVRDNARTYCTHISHISNARTYCTHISHKVVPPLVCALVNSNFVN